jgi:hypothetical protein
MQGLVPGITLAAILLSSCDLGSLDGAKANALSGQLQEDQRKIKELQDQLDRLEAKVFGISADLDKGTAYLGPEDNGFSAIETPSGRFLVALKGMRQYGDGFKLKFNIGNPQAARYTDVKVHVRWGKRFAQSTLIDEATAKSLTVPLYRDLHSGSWNPVEVVVAPATEAEVGAVELSLETPTVNMAAF